MLRGKVRREGRWWTAEVPMAGVYTQGKSRRDARTMLADAFESIVNVRGFAVTVTDLGVGPDGSVDVVVEASEPSRLAAYVLRYQRAVHGISLAQAARAIGQSSKTAYARYEQGRAIPTLDKFAELLAAVAPDLMLTIGERRR